MGSVFVLNANACMFVCCGVLTVLCCACHVVCVRVGVSHVVVLAIPSQVMRLPDSELSGVPTCLYGAASGAVGLVASLPRELFEMLAALQNGLKKVGVCRDAIVCAEST